MATLFEEFAKAASENKEFAKVFGQALELKDQREKEEEKRILLEKMREEIEMRERQEAEYRRKADINLTKILFSYRFCPDSYAFNVGIVWANSYEEAAKIIKRKYPVTDKLKIEKVDCSKPSSCLIEYYE